MCTFILNTQFLLNWAYRFNFFIPYLTKFHFTFKITFYPQIMTSPHHFFINYVARCQLHLYRFSQIYSVVFWDV